MKTFTRTGAKRKVKDKYSPEEQKKFAVIDNECFFKAVLVVGGDKKDTKSMILEWGTKLKDAGMDQSDLARHVGYIMDGSDNDDAFSAMIKSRKR